MVWSHEPHDKLKFSSLWEHEELLLGNDKPIAYGPMRFVKLNFKNETKRI